MGGAWFQKTEKVYFSIVKEAALTFSELPTSIRKQAAWRDHGSRIMQDQSEQRNCPRRSYRSTGLYIHNWQKRRGFLMLVSKSTFLINLPLKTHVVTLDRFDEHTLFKFPLMRITEIKFSKSFFFFIKKIIYDVWYKYFLYRICFLQDCSRIHQVTWNHFTICTRVQECLWHLVCKKCSVYISTGIDNFYI